MVMRDLISVLLLVLAAGANGQVIWGIKSLAPNNHPEFSAPPTVLFRMVGADGATFIALDTLRYDGVPADVDAMCQLQDGRLLAWRMLPTGSQAVLIDTLNGDLTAFGTGDTLFGRELRGAATNSAGEVWALDALNASAVRIDTANGSVALEVPLTFNGMPWSGCPYCDIAFSDSACYITGSHTIYLADLLTGTVTTLYLDTQTDAGDVLYTCNGTPANPPPINRGLAYLPNPGTLITFDTACEDDLFAYPLGGLSQRQELVDHLIPEFNSGGGDLAGPPLPYAPPSAAGPHLWGVFSKAVSNNFGPPSVLLRITPGASPTAVQVDTLRRMPGSSLVEIDALAQHATLGLLGYMVYPDSSVLCQVDTLTALCTPLAPGLPGSSIRGAACDASGQLWAIDRNSNSLLHISLPTGQVMNTVGITLNGAVYNMSSLYAFDIAFLGPVLYFQAADQLFQLDALTGVLTPQYTHVEDDVNDVFGTCSGAPFPPSFGGIAFHWDVDTVLYCSDANCEDDLYIYAMDQQPAVEVVSNPVPQFNSGSNDLASLTPSFTVGLQHQEPERPVLHACFEQGALFLSGPQLPSNSMLRISDLAGRIAVLRSLTDPRRPIHGLHLSPGIHLVELTDGVQRWTTRLVVGQ